MIKRFIDDRCAATAIEYGLVAAMIAMAIIVGMGSVGTAVSVMWGDNNGQIQQTLN